jgi:hypothetical protein
VCIAAGCGSFSTAGPPPRAPGHLLTEADLEMGAAVVVEVRIRGAGGDAALGGGDADKPKAWPGAAAAAADAKQLGGGDAVARVQPLLLGSPVPSPRPGAPAAAAAVPPSNGGDDGLCTICCDRAASCVFMECGHGGYCWRCAHVLYVRPPNECPVCRARIEMVLEIAEPEVPLGSRAPVRCGDGAREARGRAAAAAAFLSGCLQCPGGAQVQAP